MRQVDVEVDLAACPGTALLKILTANFVLFVLFDPKSRSNYHAEVRSEILLRFSLPTVS